MLTNYKATLFSTLYTIGFSFHHFYQYPNNLNRIFFCLLELVCVFKAFLPAKLSRLLENEIMHRASPAKLIRGLGQPVSHGSPVLRQCLDTFETCDQLDIDKSVFVFQNMFS